MAEGSEMNMVCSRAWGEHRLFALLAGCCKTLIPACAGTASAALRSSLVIAMYREVRLIPRDFARLASECF